MPAKTTLCDVCAAEVTGLDSINVYGYTVCMVERQFKIYLTRDHGILLTCEHLAKLYIQYPYLANQTFFKAMHRPENVQSNAQNLK